VGAFVINCITLQFKIATTKQKTKTKMS